MAGESAIAILFSLSGEVGGRERFERGTAVAQGLRT
jgi:hypothetical protein